MNEKLSIAKAIELYDNGNGFSIREIANMTGVSRDAVRTRLIAGKARIRPKGGVLGMQITPSLKIKQMVFLYERLGWTAIEIANYMGYKSGTSVTRHLRRAGVQLRSRSENSKRGYQTRREIAQRSLERAA